MSNLRTVTPTELANLLLAIKRPTPISFTALTPAKYRKTGCPYLGGIFKLSKCRPFTATHYARAVATARAKEGHIDEYVPESPIYERLGPALVRYPNGNLCLPVQFNASASKQQTSRAIYLTRAAEGAPLLITPLAAVAPYLSEQREPVKQGLVNPVYWRTFGLGNMVSVSLPGERVRVRAENRGAVPKRAPRVKPAPYVSPLVPTIHRAMIAAQSRAAQGDQGSHSVKPAPVSPLRATIRAKVRPLRENDPMDEGLHPMDQGEHGDHERA